MTRKRVQNARHVVDRWNSVFQVLCSEPRRQIIVSLLDQPQDASVPLPESAMNPSVPVDFDKLETELYHRHLPMLAEEQLVHWEPKPLKAYRGPRFEEAAIVMELLQSSAQEIPDPLVVGCQRLEEKRQQQFDR